MLPSERDEGNPVSGGNRRLCGSCAPEVLSMDIAVDGDEVELSYDFGNVPFQRIRRITGYLVGTLDRFNNAKRAEEHDRVKHGMPAAV